MFPIRRTLDWLLPGSLWLWLFYHLHDDWSLNSQYNFGWSVPLLAAFLFFLRWQTRPAPRPFARSNLVDALRYALLLPLLPLRVVEEANPDWRLLGWVLALIVVGFTLLTIARAGGWPWVAHFAFPVCFPLVAVPWLVQAENVVIQTMARAVAHSAVEIAGWIGIGAYQLGNVIQLRNGFVGVDEACSGVKTLQAGIMVSLALGELFHLRVLRRVALVCYGCTWVFICNVFRATTLVVMAATRGFDALARYHDLIGTIALVLGMGGLIVLALLWKGKAPLLPDQRRPRAVSVSSPAELTALVWIVATFGLTELWYRSHERELTERPRWQVQLPEANQTLRSLPIAETTRTILRYDDAASAAWDNPPGVHWWTFFARWKPERAALQLVRSHSPEICLPAAGRTFRGEESAVAPQTAAGLLQFRAYEFEQDAQPLFVFVCIQDDKVFASSLGAEPWNTQGRLLAAWHGKRNLGQRFLEIAVLGLADFAEAREAVGKIAGEIVAVRRSTD